MPNIFYLDYELGNDANDGSDWANAWKTFTLGATLARIAPGDVIRIAKSPAPTSIGNGTWTNLSKTVTLASAQTLTIDLCETAWTAGVGSDCTVTRTAVATDAKEGSYCMKLAVDSSPQANILQAYYATGELNLSAYQKISFWIKNSGVIVADNWIVNLCSDEAGATVVDSFLVPAIPSTLSWLPLTLTKVGGGNLGASIKSIAVYSGATTTGMASKYIYVDDFIACTTDGLNLQSLISKNTAEQGGTEGWYGIQSINGVAVLLDNNTATKSNAGQGYSTSGTTPETVTTYKRETIKTDLAALSSTQVQQIMDSGSSAVGNIQFQGGYDTTSGEQTGETFFDGLSGCGYGIYATGKSYFTLNYLNVIRYYYGSFLTACAYNTITNLNNANNNTADGLFLANSSNNNTISTLSNANNNGAIGVHFYNDCMNNIIVALLNANNNTGSGIKYEITSNNNIINTLSNASNNHVSGVYYTGNRNNLLTLLSHADNNDEYGVYCGENNLTIRSLSTTGNTSGGVYFVVSSTSNYLNNALIAEATEITFAPTVYSNYRAYSNNHDKDITKNWIYTDGGTINSEATDRVGGTGIMWKLAITSVNRSLYYPLKLSIAKIAVVADKLVTVKAYMKKSHATNIGAMLVCPGGQLAGMTVADITDTKADDLDTWEQLEINFIPTQAGVVEVECWAFYLLANANVCCEDIEISQAD